MVFDHVNRQVAPSLCREVNRTEHNSVEELSWLTPLLHGAFGRHSLSLPSPSGAPNMLIRNESSGPVAISLDGGEALASEKSAEPECDVVDADASDATVLALGDETPPKPCKPKKPHTKRQCEQALRMIGGFERDLEVAKFLELPIRSASSASTPQPRSTAMMSV